jgi:predicted dehydrogenase
LSRKKEKLKRESKVFQTETSETRLAQHKARLSLAIIGCGAVTELGHLPAAASSNVAIATILVDKNLARAQQLARQFHIPHVSDDYREVFGKADAAIVALPHYLHAPVSIDLLKQGIHVLVEKPMALNLAECDAMIEAAKQNNAILAVGVVRRFLSYYTFGKTLMDSGFLGRISSFDIREGSIYGWPVASDFFFRKETAGGGVLIDTGAYTMDMVQWWFGKCRSLEYLDDNMGGVEANCEIRLQMENGAKGYIELSRTRNLRNTIIIQGEKGTVEASLHSPRISIDPRDASTKVVGDVLELKDAKPKVAPLAELLRMQLEDWIGAITNKTQPRVPGEEGRKSVELIEACYRNRKPLELSWLSPIATEDMKR